MLPPRPQALLFDLGGVLLDVDMTLAFRAWAQHSSLTPDDIATQFKALPYLEDHERGAMDDQAFFEALRQDLKLAASLSAIEHAWTSIFTGEIEATRRLVQRASYLVPCYALTNSTASHLATWPALFPDLRACFNQVFASFQIGQRKPEASVFLGVCKTLRCRPDSVLFFDDSAVNSAAAAGAGLQSVLVRSTADVEAALRAHGLLRTEA